MLRLDDFYHLPDLDALVEQLVADGPGLVVVAGLDPRPLVRSASTEGFLPSGRSTIFRILMREILTTDPSMRAIVVAESKEAVRIPSRLRRQVEWSLGEPPRTYAECIADAIRQRPEMLVVDRLCPETANLALDAAEGGLRVLSQIDTVFRGANLARGLLDLGARRERLAGCRWVVAVQRLATLCPRCKQPAPPEPRQWAELQRRYPDLVHRCPDLLQGAKATFFQATGCADCHYTGRQGEVAAFDIFQAGGDIHSLFEQPSLLPLEEYVLRLVASGHLPLDDLLRLESDQLRRTYHLLTASERALAEAKTALERKLVQFEAAHRVLQQRTEALISLQGIGQALISAVSLNDLAKKVCRHSRDLCSADRAILYFLRSEDTAEVLAVSGWDPARVPQQVEAARIVDTNASTEPMPFNGWPPGIPPRHPDVEGAVLRAGLRVPLIAQGKPVGAMIVHTTQKAGFTPGEVALLQTLAQQAALAIQRTGLIEQLRLKIAQLEAAQVELVKKERMEQELKLAREVQQCLLTRTFPLVSGYEFAARYEPARQVGGDLYDVISLDADHFGLVIADVSDRGMPAAFYMALTRSLLLAEARRELSPCAALTNVNQLLLEVGEPCMFVSVFYGVIERAARQLTYARAGHDYPLLLRKGTIQELAGEGTILGLLPGGDLHLSEEQVALAPGDRLVLYTDGVTDALSPDGQPFDLARFKSLLQVDASLPPADLCAAIFAELAAHQGDAEQYDDMTMLIVEVK